MIQCSRLEDHWTTTYPEWPGLMQTTFIWRLRQCWSNSADHWKTACAHPNLPSHHTFVDWEASLLIFVFCYPISERIDDALVDSLMADSQLGPGEKHDFLGLPRDFGEDFGTSCASNDYLTYEIHLSVLCRLKNDNVSSFGYLLLNVFPRCDMLRRISSSQSNRSSIACEFFRRTVSYVFFRSSLVPFSPRLVWCRWKPSKDIGCETILGIWETWIDPSIWEIWIRSRCNEISSLGFTIFYRGGGYLLIGTWTATTIT